MLKTPPQTVCGHLCLLERERPIQPSGSPGVFFARRAHGRPETGSASSKHRFAFCSSAARKEPFRLREATPRRPLGQQSRQVRCLEAERQTSAESWKAWPRLTHSRDCPAPWPEGMFRCQQSGGRGLPQDSQALKVNSGKTSSALSGPELLLLRVAPWKLTLDCQSPRQRNSHEIHASAAALPAHPCGLFYLTRHLF